ncbi:flagellin [Parvularcula sp. ZS-1/3]|uniref:Flagellin n=1 Tax=Parvularcula mediterranea TaxID=2732508 RepID=A0A7Y3RJW5_9PROT|nr:flagellin [Parvularcula mediterranea]NNU15376.1 flagellin [Parvularcula mediterranea]
MVSINFNESAQVALMSLNKVNSNLFKVQDMISTGRKVATARDNAAVWAISTVMQSDVMGFKQITDSLNLGLSTVEVARAASEQVTELLKEIKAEIVSAKEQNVDRTAIQRDISALRDQISSIVDAAQFNGLNLLQGGADVKVLSSLNRDANGVVSTADISVARADFRQVEGVFGTNAIAGGEAGDTVVSGATIASAATGTVTIDAVGTGPTNIDAGFSFDVTIASETVQYIAKEGDTVNDVANGLVAELEKRFAEMEANSPGSAPDVTLSVTLGSDPTTQNAVINIVNNEGSAIALASDSFDDGVSGGDLGRLVGIDVDTTVQADIDQALLDVEDMIQTVIDSTAAFGSVQNRIDIQNNFLTSLTASLEAGVSSLTDANLEEASARLQALQVQQQLNIQALSIANAAPAALLSLFQ